MANVQVTIWHDAITGEIVAIGQAMGESAALGLAADNQGVFVLEIAEEAIAELPRTHRVHPDRRELIDQSYNAAVSN